MDGKKTENEKESCFIRCPYDNRHFVWQRNYEAHLSKCASKHPRINLMFCPFNTSHRCANMETLVIYQLIWFELLFTDFIFYSFSEQTHREMSKPRTIRSFYAKRKQLILIQSLHFNYCFAKKIISLSSIQKFNCIQNHKIFKIN